MSPALQEFAVNAGKEAIYKNGTGNVDDIATTIRSKMEGTFPAR